MQACVIDQYQHRSRIRIVRCKHVYESVDKRLLTTDSET